MQEAGKKLTISISQWESIFWMTGAMTKIRPLTNKTVPDIPRVNVWEFLSRQNPFALASFLVKEHPQTVAVILSQLQDDLSAQIVEYFPPDIQPEVLLRIQQLTRVSVPMMCSLEAVLLAEISNMVADNTPAFVNGVEKAERILANLSAETAAKIIEYFQQEDETLGYSSNDDLGIIAVNNDSEPQTTR